MIEPKDASTCDERRVKNKLNPLTHKKKGETRTMSIQGTKHWQLGMFFVISLMLTVGLLSNVAIAHNALENDSPLGNVLITSNPKSVAAGSMVDLTVRYSATGILADPDATGNNGEADPTFGRIRIGLPAGWGPANSDEIFFARQKDRNATYFTVTKKSTGVVVAPFGEVTVTGSRGPVTAGETDYVIDIDVTSMGSRRYVELTIRNLSIPNLGTTRGAGDSTRYSDISTVMDLARLTVFSDSTPNAPAASPAHPPRTTFKPKVAVEDDPGGSDEQPTITVNRKILGELAVSPAEVTAGSKQDFTITYTASEILVTDPDNDDVVDDTDAIAIEVRLPDWDADPSTLDRDPPIPYQFADTKPTTDRSMSYVYLGGSASKLAGTTISVVNGIGTSAFTDVDPDDGVLAIRDNDVDLADADPSWIVRIKLGHRDVSNKDTIALKYNDVIVQRAVATDAETTDTPPNIQAFSGPSFGTVLPQFPVKEQEKDIITVKHAADGSGTVMFALDDDTGVTYKEGSLLNSRNSVPAGPY